MTSVARDEANHLAQIIRILNRCGARLTRHKDPCANELRDLVRKGVTEEILDRLMVTALIEARSCERFRLLGEMTEDEEIGKLYKVRYSSEFGHYKDIK